MSNRTPRPSETLLGTPFWQALAELCKVESVVAVGNVAQHSLQRSGLAAPKIRHPAHGGRAAFKHGLEQLLASGMRP
jgi:uracil-DNA glycosylase